MAGLEDRESCRFCGTDLGLSYPGLKNKNNICDDCEEEQEKVKKYKHKQSRRERGVNG